MADNYLVLPRKYRPRRFGDLIGQPHIVEALRNSIAQGRVAQAFLFTGSRGTGKTTSARLFASALNCLRRGDSIEPCGECESCLGVARGEDLDVIEMDAASNSRVDDIRERLESVETRPARGHFRVYIIDEVHMLSTSAFNALLKTLEEPPPHVKFILATTNPEKIPETIASRCQRYDFRRVTTAEIVARLEEICAAEKLAPGPGLLQNIAEISEGGVRDALGRLDQLVAFAGDKPTVEHAEKVFGLVSRPKLLDLLEALGKGDARAGLVFAEEAFDGGKDVAEVLGSLIALTRVLMLLAASHDTRGLDIPPPELPRLTAVANRFGLTGLVYVAEILSDCRQRVRRAAFPRVMVEAAFIKLAMIGQLEPLSKLLERLEGMGEDSSAEAENSQDAPARAPQIVQSPVRPEGAPPAVNARTGPTETERRALEAVKKHFGAR